jgi:hypothetical protein
MAIEWRSVFSSHIESVGYDPDTSEYLVKWGRGKVSAYTGVPPELAKQVSNAPSVGSAIHEFIKPKFPHKYIA